MEKRPAQTREEIEALEKSRVDFLGHLRLVHLSLAAICLALLVAASIAPPSPIENAYRQAIQIRSVANEAINWVRENTRPTLAAQVERLYKKKSFFISDGRRMYSIVALPGPVRSDIFKSVDDLDSYLTYNDRWDPSEPTDVPFPSTLEDFQALWNRLYHWGIAFVIDDWRPDQARVQLDTTFTGAGEVIVETVRNKLRDTLWLHDKDTRLDRSKENGWELVYEFPPVTGDRQHQHPVRVLRIPVTLVRSQDNYQKRLVGSLKVQWLPGEFAETFPDLSKFAKGIESLRFRQLESYLERLRSEVRPPVQLFGAAIPGESLRKWGPVVLIAIQLYFLLHLRRYNRLFQSSGSSTRFAWIGIYEDPISRLVFGLSITALPLVTIMIISATHQEEYYLPLPTDWIGWVALGVSSFIALTSFFELGLLIDRVKKFLTKREVAGRKSK
jgi:hypothetical protein